MEVTQQQLNEFKNDLDYFKPKLNPMVKKPGLKLYFWGKIDFPRGKLEELNMKRSNSIEGADYVIMDPTRLAELRSDLQYPATHYIYKPTGDKYYSKYSYGTAGFTLYGRGVQTLRNALAKDIEDKLVISDKTFKDCGYLATLLNNSSKLVSVESLHGELSSAQEPLTPQIYNSLISYLQSTDRDTVKVGMELLTRVDFTNDVFSMCLLISSVKCLKNHYTAFSHPYSNSVSFKQFKDFVKKKSGKHFKMLVDSNPLSFADQANKEQDYLFLNQYTESFVLDQIQKYTTKGVLPKVEIEWRS